MLGWLRRRLARPAPAPVRILCDGAGLTLTDGARSHRLPFAEVRRVAAFARPAGLGSTLALVLESAEGTVEIHEELEGWAQALDAIEARLPRTMGRAAWMARLAADPATPVLLLDRDA